MPKNLVLVRHGESEPNIFQKQRKLDPNAAVPEGFMARHDSRMRLSKRGCEQADVTGEWLRQAFPCGFDRYYVSSLIRTRETAGRLGLNGTWDVDDRWRERDWGVYGALSGAEQEQFFAHYKDAKELSKWYWCPPGGESLATDVRTRFEDIIDTLHRELDGKDVIAVTHGETIGVARFILERMLPEDWEEQERGSDYTLANCQIVHFTRTNPQTGELRPHIEWRRSVCAWDTTRSWNGGEWVHLGERPRFTDADLLHMADAFPVLLSDEV